MDSHTLARIADLERRVRALEAALALVQTPAPAVAVWASSESYAKFADEVIAAVHRAIPDLPPRKNEPCR